MEKFLKRKSDYKCKRVTDFNLRDILDPKKNRRVAELLEDDKAKWKSIKKEKQSQKIKIGSKSAIDKLYSNSKSNISFNDSGKMDIDKIAKTVRQNLSHNISAKGNYLDNYAVKDKYSKTGGLFFEKTDVKVVDKKDSKFKSIFSSLMRKKKEIEFMDIATLCRNEMESAAPQFKQASGSLEENDANLIEEDDSMIRTDLSKHDILNQLKRSFDIKDIYSQNTDEVEHVTSTLQPEPREPIEKKDLKSNVLNEFDSIFNLKE